MATVGGGGPGNLVSLGMPSQPNRYRRFTHEAVFAVFAACGAYVLSSWSFGLFASSPVSEPFVGMDGMAAFMFPFAAIAVASGFLAGLIVSVSVREHSVRVALWAGLLGCAIQLVIAVAVGGLAWAAHNYALLGAPCLAVGLLLGALLGRKIRHA